MMIRRSLREWDYLPVRSGGGDDSIPRSVADGLVATARSLGMHGAEPQAILVDRNKHLQAQQVVGVLASPDAILEILPKIDGLDEHATRHNLVHMLAAVFDLKLASGAMTDLGRQKLNLLEILIGLFCDQLFAALRRGLPRQYVDETADLPALRGRLDVKRQFTVLALSPQKLASRYQELSPDIALPRIMKAAVHFLAGITRSAENQRRLMELSIAFADISLIPIAHLPWSHVVLDRTNIAWGALFNFARLLLGRQFQTTSAGGSRGFSLMFEMNVLFEEYIGRMMRRALRGSAIDVDLQGPQGHVLQDEDGTRRFATRPDIVLSCGGRPVLVIDTKWKRLKGLTEDTKRGVSQGDVYQMMAYSRVYGCQRLVLLYPHHSELGPAAGKLCTYQVRGAADVKLSVAAIALTDLAQVGARLKALVADEIALLSGVEGAMPPADRALNSEGADLH